jgi:hypothetical protein
MADYKNEKWWIDLQKSLEGFDNDTPQMSDKQLSHWNGTKLGGKSAVKSGQLLRAAVNGGKSQGKIRGKINVESGHLDNIRKLAITKEARIKAKANTDYKAIAEKQKKPIYQFSMDGKFIAEYPSLKDAAIAVGCHPCNITAVANGYQKSCKKSIWKHNK